MVHTHYESLLRRWGLKLYRITILVLAVIVINYSYLLQTSFHHPLPLELIRKHFPQLHRSLWDETRQGWKLYDSRGLPLGWALPSSPLTDHIIGYSGSTSLLILLNTEGQVLDVELLRSQETPEHVHQVINDRAFWQQFQTWNAHALVAQTVDAVSGSTLTSMAIAEAVAYRLSGTSLSYRFPQPITLEEVREIYPHAYSLQPHSEYPNRWIIYDHQLKAVAQVLHTSPAADAVRGFQGPTDLLLLLDPDGSRVLKVKIRHSYDTPEYVNRLLVDPHYLDQLRTWSWSEWAELDLNSSGLEGVSGATMTSFAVAASIHRRARQDRDQKRSGRKELFPIRQGVMFLILIGGIIMMIIPQRQYRWLRRPWQICLIILFASGLADLLSLNLLVGWSRHGVPWRNMPGLCSVVALSLLFPWSLQHNWYCHQVCPHGAIQEWLTRLPVRRWHIPPSYYLLLHVLPGFLLVGAWLLALSLYAPPLAWLEPFDGWILKLAAPISLTILILSLLLAIKVPMAYCRFGCPTGALLKLIRAYGRYDRFRITDGVAGMIVLASGFSLRIFDYSTHQLQPDHKPYSIGGHTTRYPWSITFRDPLDEHTHTQVQRHAEQLLERAELIFSSEHPNSELSTLNVSRTRFALEIGPELSSVFSLLISVPPAYKSILPNCFGEPVAHANQPMDLHDPHLPLQFTFDPETHTVTKRDPEAQILLPGFAEAWFIDELTDSLVKLGHSNFLIRCGNMCRAQGCWEMSVIFETPTISGITLCSKALATADRCSLEDAEMRGNKQQDDKSHRDSIACIGVIADTSLTAHLWLLLWKHATSEQRPHFYTSSPVQWVIPRADLSHP
ncbi:MAG: hypothetical protein KatS3mg113_0835 [Planctomycetaceae bacterium]|nr:MAG: hypothetical protein KatS3mg113_0835 [Planctomycetaceae bacterium]